MSRPAINRHYWLLFVPTFSALIAAQHFGLFSGWAGWQQLGLVLAAGVLISEVADVLYDRSRHRAGVDSETPP
jgi:hypothetical protein